MKAKYPFVIPFFELKCDFFEEIKEDLISVIFDIHNKNPFELICFYLD